MSPGSDELDRPGCSPAWQPLSKHSTILVTEATRFIELRTAPDPGRRPSSRKGTRPGLASSRGVPAAATGKRATSGYMKPDTLSLTSPCRQAIPYPTPARHHGADAKARWLVSHDLP